jgi:hypothetical protein
MPYIFVCTQEFFARKFIELAQSMLPWLIRLSRCEVNWYYFHHFS